MAKKEHIVVGLDIGTTKICAIVAQVTPDEGVTIIGVGSSPSRGLRKGIVVNIDSTVESIKKAVEEAELMAAVQINSVYIGIAGSHIASQTVKGVVALKRNEVFRSDVLRAVETAKASAVVPPDRQVLHVLPREFIVDDQEGIQEPVGISGARLEVDVHVVTGAIPPAKNLMKCVNRAGLDVVGIVLQPLASSEAVLTDEEKGLGIVMVDLGGGTTDLAIFSDGTICHSAVLPVGGQHITTDLQIGLRTSLADAEEIKVRYGSALVSMVKETEVVEVPSVGGRPPHPMSRREIAEIIQPRVEEIFELVLREIYRSGYEGKLAAGVVITGGTSMLEGMPDAAELVLDLPGRRGVPYNVGGLLDIVRNPMFSTGVGLIVQAYRTDHEFEFVGGSRKAGSGLGGVFGRMKSWVLNLF